MTDKPTILVFIPDPIFAKVISPESLRTLAGFAEVRRAKDWADMDDTQLQALFEGVDGVLTSWGVHPFPSKAFLECPTVKILSHAAGGVRWAPRAALEKGVVFTNASRAMAPQLAELCLTFALMGIHNVLELVQPDRVVNSVKPFRRAKLRGKRVGLVGFGWIARSFVEFLKPFDVDVLAYDPYVPDEVMHGYGVTPAALHDIFTRSDIVSIHAGLTDESRKMIGADLLSKLKDSSVFINTSRGPVVDHDALIEELRKKRFIAFLDVTDPEPLPEGHELFSMSNVILSYHRAASRDEPGYEVGNAAVGELKRFFSGEPLVHEVKLEWYDRMT